MIRNQLILDVHDELIVDHDRLALGMHRINHPQTVHHCEDIFDIDPRSMCEGRPIGLAHFSPDCKHFSKAKGGKPLDKRIRGLVLVMLRYAKYGARVMTMENVEEIKTWGPLKKMFKHGAWGMYPDPDHRGRTWQAFLDILSFGINSDHPDLPEIIDVLAGTITVEDCVRGFGYQFTTTEIRACDFGSPTIRKRLYMVARNDGAPILVPDASHFDPSVQRVPKGGKPWRTIAECIDWELPCPSIFLTREQARVARCKRPLAKATLRRAARGIDRYVLKAKRPFLVSLTHQGGDRIESVDEPAKTLTAAHRGEKAVVAPVLTEHANQLHERNFAVDEPLRTQCAEVKGGHFAMVAGSLVQTGYGEREGQAPRAIDPNRPMGTAVAGGNKHAVVTGTLVHTAHGEQDSKGKKRGRGAREVSEPMPSVLASPDGAIVTGTLVGAGGRAAQSRPRGVDEPMHTTTAKADTCVAAASMVKLRGTNIGDAVDQPAHTISAGGTHHGLIAAHLTKFHEGSTGADLSKPMPTVTCAQGGAGGTNGIIAAYLAQQNGGFNENPGHSADGPASTISATGSQQQVVAASLTAYYGNDEDGQSVTEPARTVTTKDRLGFVESRAVSPMTAEQIAGAHRVAAFLREHGVQFEGEFATVQGYVIVDIGMRMLTPRELFRAQGFQEDYVIDRAWVVDPQTGEVVVVRLTKEQQIRMCGNSVCRQVLAALIRVNVPELAIRFGKEKAVLA